MKKMLKLSFLAICILSLTNCNKEETENLVSAIEVTINNSNDYELDLMISGDEEGATIKTQAQHFQKSELIGKLVFGFNVLYSAGLL